MLEFLLKPSWISIPMLSTQIKMIRQQYCHGILFLTARVFYKEIGSVKLHQVVLKLKLHTFHHFTSFSTTNI